MMRTKDLQTQFNQYWGMTTLQALNITAKIKRLSVVFSISERTCWRYLAELKKEKRKMSVSDTGTI